MLVRINSTEKNWSELTEINSVIVSHRNVKLKFRNMQKLVYSIWVYWSC